MRNIKVDGRERKKHLAVDNLLGYGGSRTTLCGRRVYYIATALSLDALESRPKYLQCKRCLQIAKKKMCG